MKETNWLLGLVIILVLASCGSTRLNGTYEYLEGVNPELSHTLAGYSYRKLILKKDRTFSFQKSSRVPRISTMSKDGFGTYELAEDTLTLNYQGCPESVARQVDSLKRDAALRKIIDFDKQANTDDRYVTIALQFSILEGSDTMAYSFVSLTCEKLEAINHKYYGMIDNVYEDDWDGKVEIQVLKTDFPLEIKCASLGLLPIDLTFEDPEYNYRYHLLMIDMVQVMEPLNLRHWLYGSEKLKRQKNSFVLPNRKVLKRKK